MIKRIDLKLDAAIVPSPMRKNKELRLKGPQSEFPISPVSIQIHSSGRARATQAISESKERGTLVAGIATLRNNAEDISSLQSQLSESVSKAKFDSISGDIDTKFAEIIEIIKRGAFDKVAKRIEQAVDLIQKGTAGKAVAAGFQDLSKLLGPTVAKALESGDTFTLGQIGQKLKQLSSFGDSELLKSDPNALKELSKTARDLLKLLDADLELDDVLELPAEGDAQLELKRTIQEVALDIAKSVASLADPETATVVHKVLPGRARGLLL
ncbi:MAG: hypothetical protein J5J00_17165 [Deltaproteobacteria bacterium]|nr:hypothetical protein [Deltaproteobacteria bacterium]